MPRAGPFARLLLGAVLGVCATLAIVLADTSLHRFEAVQRMTQPEHVEYPEDTATHYVGIVRKRSWLLGRPQTYEVYTGRFPDLIYGHFVEIAITNVERPVLREVDWRLEGVHIRFDSGHELFVPAKAVLGGR
ncbi:hypothetical protein OHB12_22540 [Nocardia sp. NBC_01730]|uniref:hypothetical protein n=1 Tax=Nocardia sp. NBC_01730 TaxID=2975998 RepID=UPI002E132518|nr:hypothetical protein OHB12_22540 [Nocardia sp. NBC_01730]